MSVKLKLLVGDTKLEAQRAANEASNLAKSGCVGFIGPGFSGPSVRVSNLLSMPSIDRAIISYSATSPQLSTDEFSNFLRTKESDAVPAKLIAKLMTGLLYSVSREILQTKLSLFEDGVNAFSGNIHWVTTSRS